MKSNLLPIAREGWNYLYISVGLFVFFMVFNFSNLAFLSFLASAFFIFVFRNPERENILYQENSVVSPLDGIVSSIEELNETNEYKVDIDSTHFNVALLRVPFTSAVSQALHVKGARLNQGTKLFNTLNEYAQITFTDKNSQSIKIIHKLKQTFAPINIEAKSEQNLLQGTRYGYMLNGITTIYFPRNFRLNIDVGTNVVAGQTLLGYFIPQKKD